MTNNFGENLKKLRKSKELTQETFADFLGVSFQAVSKWERGESYPDIVMLPAIASFFSVTTDSLLGLNEFQKEAKIKEYQDKYYSLWSEHKIEEVRDMLKKAISEFPGNFDLLVKYFNALIQANFEIEYRLSVKSEVKRVYDSIQTHCTDDRIRIWAKKLMCIYLRDLSFEEKSGVSISEAEEILEEMPLMQNTRDYLAMFLYPQDNEKRAKVCAQGTAEILYLLGESINRKHPNPLEFDEKIIKAYINLVEAVLPDGDYGKCFPLMVYSYGYVGVKNYVEGNISETNKNFEKMCNLAKKYDSLPNISIHTSYNLEGLEFNKLKTGLGKEKLSERVKHHMLNNYPLSDEFKNGEEFKKIIAILE